MNTGICYLIHNKDEYPSNKKKIIKAIEKKNLDLDYIYDASIIEFRDDLYLIIDGHTSFLDDDKFVSKLSKLICPAYKEDPKRLEDMDRMLQLYFMFDEIEAMKDNLDAESVEFYEAMRNMMEKANFSLEKVPREYLYSGMMYGEDDALLCKLFNIESETELLEKLVEDIFKATSEKISVGEVRFVETLYQMEM